MKDASAATPRYFFHIKYRSKTIRDEEDMDLEDLNTVREEARESARQVLEDEAFVVADEQGQTVLTFPFKDAIDDCVEG